MSKTGDKRSAEIFRRKVRELLAAGHSVAHISKVTGKSYVHTARIVEQERDSVTAALMKGATS